jgi:hypothetical protein
MSGQFGVHLVQQTANALLSIGDADRQRRLRRTRSAQRSGRSK